MSSGEPGEGNRGIRGTVEAMEGEDWGRAGVGEGKLEANREFPMSFRPKAVFPPEADEGDSRSGGIVIGMHRLD